MREIKFRVRDKINSKIIGYECLISTDIRNTNYEWACSVNGQDWTNDIFRSSNLKREQYTGLKDKNGKEIYEGDIVTWADRKKEYQKVGVYWNEVKVGFIFGGLEAWQSEQCKVIGNIYDNAELLKGGVNK